ncbi:PriCT-2 domain-containing protein [Marinimicrobium sp. ABcell2]|uniref:PriCT-2 domain-containing protein n=1 Tax=Marinimicrobium sp. ABcell2 TaxID=3069751 RepID=UPI0027AE7B6A|nr:PriCT-2 domain-containing protein [Marinimicrobium sp. ABcell2]MDQ2077627.1 PriCT-2 domain-containing protein [Marinimicrobium sp. ABcell2]
MQTKKYPGRSNGQGTDKFSNTSNYSTAKTESLSLDDVRQMLSFIPADDYDEWQKAGMAIHSEFDDSGFSVWDDWSQSADNYKPASARTAWQSFNPGAIKIGSLVYLAKRYGWSPQSDPKPLRPIPNPKPAPKPIASNTQRYALELWLASDYDDDVVAGHEYAQRKGIDWAAGAARGIASGKLIGKQADCIIVPIYSIETGKLQGVQCINSEGEKQSFGRVSGGCLLLGNTLNKASSWYVAEGWASAVSMAFHHCKGNSVCAASFGKSQLENTARKIGEVHQPSEIVILQEVDA